MIFGNKVTLQGTQIILPQGIIEVVRSCSGLNSITYMLGLAVIVLVMFPTSRDQKILVPFVAATLGFVVNGVRIATLAILVGSESAFEYWHSQEGAFVFGISSVILFGAYCLYFIRPPSAQ